MLTKEAAVPVVRRVSSLTAKSVLNVNGWNVFLAAIKKVIAQTHRAIEHPLNRIRNKLAPPTASDGAGPLQPPR